jgi:hypothetical protein
MGQLVANLEATYGMHSYCWPPRSARMVGDSG